MPAAWMLGEGGNNKAIARLRSGPAVARPGREAGDAPTVELALPVTLPGGAPDICIGEGPSDMNSGESGADRIRRHVRARYIDAARREGGNTVTIRAGDVARELRLGNRVPAVCSALASKLLLDQAGLRLVERRGPRQSTTTEFRYAFAGGRVENGTEEVEVRNPAPLSQRSVNNASQEAAPPAASGALSTLYLVSCVKTKRNTRAAAKELYVSAWFQKARAFVEGTGDPWRILSAEYGLLDPDEEVQPYERTLKAMRVQERRAWAEDVLAHIETCLNDVDTVVFFAGQRYREFLEPALRGWGLVVRVPMIGLSQGRQMQWLNVRLHD